MHDFITKKLKVVDSWVNIRYFKLNSENKLLRKKYEEKFNIVISEEVYVTLDKN